MKAVGVASRSVLIPCEDGTLGGHLYSPTESTGEPILLCSATGVRQQFYAAFATWAVQQGFTVLTFDYRGIGASLETSHVRHCRTRKQDWGERDMPAALAFLLRETGAEKAHLVGHSAGGQLIGLMPNHGHIRSVVMVASSTGFLGGIRAPTRYAARILLGAYIPLTCALLGYAPSKRIGWGEDLPKGVALQWARWCARPGYTENDFGKSIHRHFYDAFAAPIVALHATDDPIATPENVSDLLRLFPCAQRRIQPLQPEAFNLASIGHIDIFRKRCAQVWPTILAPALEAWTDVKCNTRGVNESGWRAGSC